MYKFRTMSIAAIASLALFATACGGDDGGSGQQGEVVDKMVEAGADAGITLERDCVADLVGELSDADLKILAEASIEDDVELSAEGEAVGERMFSCVPQDELVNQIMDQIGAMEGVDEECVRGVLEEMSTEEMQSMVDGADAAGVMTKIMSCVSLGS
jgi:hypothetical protein